MVAATSGPLARFRKAGGEPEPVKVKPPRIKAKRTPPKPKGPPSKPPVMGTDRPKDDIFAELEWRAEHMARRVAKIPGDSPRTIGQKEGYQKPPRGLIETATAMMGECELPVSREFQRFHVAFWACVLHGAWMFHVFPGDKNKDARMRFAETFRKHFSNLTKTQPS